MSKEKKIKVKAFYEGVAQYANAPITLWRVVFDEIDGEYFAEMDQDQADDMIQAGRVEKV